MLESVKARCFVYSGLHCYIEFWALILAVRSRCLTSIHVFTRHCGNLNRINRLPLYLFLHLIFWFIFEIGLQFFFFSLYSIYVLLNFYFSHFRTAHFYLYLSVCFYILVCFINYRPSFPIFFIRNMFFSPLFISLRLLFYRRNIISFKGNEKYENNFFLCEGREFLLVRCFTRDR